MSIVAEGINNSIVKDLPNLKIEIENDLDEKMETDDGSSDNKEGSVSSETEEGELVDDDDRLGPQNHKQTSTVSSLTTQDVQTGRSILKYDDKEYNEYSRQASVKNPNGAFVTGVNVFSPEEQAKMDKRAQRFGLEATDAKVLTGKLLKKLHKSMGVKHSDKNIRVEALHMRGTENMSTQDVFDYFKEYGPASLEWISDNSCNVVWLDDISAARALLGLSVHITGQTVPEKPGLSDSDVDMESQAQQTDSDCLSEGSDAVALNDLGVDLPPGQWRRGAPHPLSPCVLLRFATTKDRSLPRPGFTKFGSHQFGRYVGLISESRKRRMQGLLPTSVVFEDVGDEAIPKPSVDETDNANPWGILAKTWSQFDKARKPRPTSPIIERILPPPNRMTPPPSPLVFSNSRSKLVARTRKRRGLESQHTKVVVSESGEDSMDNDEWQSRSKMPRMRMHADDEEKKLEQRLKKSHRHRSLSHSPKTRKDIRHRVGVQRSYSEKSEDEPVPAAREIEEEEEVPDLRVAVPATRSPSPKDSKVDVGHTLFQSGNVKSVLRGARSHNKNEDFEEDEVHDGSKKDLDKNKSSAKKHRTRSRERKKHHRKSRKEGSSHKPRREESASDSEGRTTKTVRSAIRKISPEIKERRKEEFDVKNRLSSYVVKNKINRDDSRENKSPRHERRRRNNNHDELETYSKSNHRRHESSQEKGSRKDLRSKLSHIHKTFGSSNEFRSKSPLQIEIDNDEYFKEKDTDQDS